MAFDDVTPDPDKPAGERPASPSEQGLPDALRRAVSDTLSATSGGAAQTRDRASGMIDELVRRGRAELERGRQEAGQLAKKGQEATGGLAKRGQEAGGELARRGQEAGGEIARRGGDAREELMKRFEAFEARLASIEDLLRRPREGDEGAGDTPAAPETAPGALAESDPGRGEPGAGRDEPQAGPSGAPLDESPAATEPERDEPHPTADPTIPSNPKAEGEG